MHLRRFIYGEFSEAYLIDPQEEATTEAEFEQQRVCRRGRQVIVKPGGFVLWTTKITLEITNLGPFHFVLEENDVIAQLTVAAISSPPDLTLKQRGSQTAGQSMARVRVERA